LSASDPEASRPGADARLTPEGTPLDAKTRPRRLLLRGVAGVTVLVLAGMMGLIAWFALETERAHDEARCPFELAVRRQPVPPGPAPGSEAGASANGTPGQAAAIVVEDRRSCVPGIAEHRWRVLDGVLGASAGDLPGHELGRRRLPEAAFDPDRDYEWSATRRPDGTVEVAVQPAGDAEVFRLSRD
jgi:hypothetical protein